MAASVGTPAGTTITLTGTAFGEVTGISFSGAERSRIDVTHFGTTMPPGEVHGGRKFIPGDLADPGECTVEIHFDPDNDLGLDDTGMQSCVLAWNGASVGTWTFNAFVVGYTMNAPENDKMVATVTLGLEQAITIS